MTLASVNKLINLYYFLFMHTHIFYYFILFYWGLGPDQPIWAGLDPASPARSLAQASDPAGQNQRKHAWSDFTRAWTVRR